MGIKIKRWAERELTDWPALLVGIVFILVLVLVEIFLRRDKFPGLFDSDPKIVIIAIIVFVISLVYLTLFRYVEKTAIWSTYVIAVILLVVVLVFSFLKKCDKKADEEETHNNFNQKKDDCMEVNIIRYMLGGISSVISILMIILFLFYCGRITFVANFLKEMMKVFFSTYILLALPVLTTFISLMIWSYVFARIKYESSTTFVILYSAAFIIFTSFVNGCQNFLIAGSVYKYYFSRGPTKGSPWIILGRMTKNFLHLLSIHLGSVFWQALIGIPIKIIDIFALILMNCRVISRPFLMFDQSTYVIISKDGTPLCESGMKTSSLLRRHVADVIALVRFGQITLIAFQLILLSIRWIVDLNKEGIKPIYIWQEVAYILFVGNSWLSHFEMTIGTIFVCFCIDLEEHDGIVADYFVSQNLRKVLDEIKKEAGGGVFAYGGRARTDVEQGGGSGVATITQSYANPVFSV